MGLFKIAGTLFAEQRENNGIKLKKIWVQVLFWQNYRPPTLSK